MIYGRSQKYVVDVDEIEIFYEHHRNYKSLYFNTWKHKWLNEKRWNRAKIKCNFYTNNTILMIIVSFINLLNRLKLRNYLVHTENKFPW